jgi:hypothetical protein
MEVKSAPERPFSLKFRIPGWCSHAEVRINGSPVNAEIRAGTFLEIKRMWSSGDQIQLDLPMPVDLIAAHPLVEECRGQVAVRRGPLVYCLESSDLPQGASILSVSLSSKTEWKPESGTGDLTGIPVLSGEVAISPDSDFRGKSHLYSKYQPLASRAIATKLIPYFAWGNRGHSEMSVWLPVVP